MKNHQNHFFGNPKHHWIAQFFPSKPLNIHHLGWSGFPGPSQKFHLQDHPIRLRQWQLRTLCLFRSSQNLGFGQGVPPTEWSECLLKLYIYIYLFIFIFICNYIYIYYVCIYIYINNNIYIYIYIQRKLSLRESATTNKFWTAWEMLQPCFDKLDDTVF